MVEETPSSVAVTHSTVAPDDSTIVVCGEVAYEIYYAILSIVIRLDKVGHKINLTLTGLCLFCGLCRGIA
jgi:hypothetical protein